MLHGKFQPPSFNGVPLCRSTDKKMAFKYMFKYCFLYSKQNCEAKEISKLQSIRERRSENCERERERRSEKK